MFELIGLVLIVVAFGLSLRALNRVRDLEERIARLESVAPTMPAERPAVRADRPEPLRDLAWNGPPLPTLRWPTSLPSSALEYFIGRKALGWVAVLLLFLAAAFFLRYAYENEWIGPLGQVSLILCGGSLLAVAGRWYAGRGWRRFSIMLTAAGVIVAYLATYSAFAYFELLPLDATQLFLVVILIEGAALAWAYRSDLLALVMVLGGLATPVLMKSEYDPYLAFFGYLLALNLGVVLLLMRRDRAAMGTLSLVGTQLLFWSWYVLNYHPEKFGAAVGFQVLLLVLYRAEVWMGDVVWRRAVHVETLARTVLVAALSFGALFELLQEDYAPWLGTLAVLFAASYALDARLLLARPDRSRWQTLTLLAITAGFVAIAIPIQADAPWVALGWAAESAALWWFGLRARATPLRAFAAVFAALAIVRLIVIDTPGVREPFIPLVNAYALPSLAIVALVIAAHVAGQRRLDNLQPRERNLTPLLGIAGLVLLGWVLTVETYGYFDAWGHIYAAERQSWQWTGQMAVSLLWAVYASTLLAAGFWRQQAALRWLAFALYGLTVAKLLAFDMSTLQEVHRIIAFFVLAVLLGIAAWAYQRRQPGWGNLFHGGPTR